MCSNGRAQSRARGSNARDCGDGAHFRCGVGAAGRWNAVAGVYNHTTELLTDTKVFKNDIEDVFDVVGAGDATEGACGVF